MTRISDYSGQYDDNLHIRIAFEQAPIGIALVNARHEITRANPALCHILGYTASELTGVSFRSFTHPDDLEDSIVNHEKLFSGLVQSYQLTKRYIRKDGQHVWCRVSVSLGHDERTDSNYAIAHIEDAFQDRLLAIERKVLAGISADDSLQTILDSLSSMAEALFSDIRCSILLADADGKHLRHGAAPSLPAAYNKAIDGIAIGPRAGSCGTAAYLRRQVITADISSDPCWDDYRELALEHGLHACWSMPVISANGKVLGTFALYYGMPKYPSEQHKQLIRQVTGLVAIAINRHDEHKLLQLSEEKYRALYDENPVMYVTLESDSRIVSANRHAIEVLNYRPEELVNRHGLDLVHDEDLATARRNLQDCLDNPGVVQNCSVRIRMHNGAYIWTRLTGRAIRDANGESRILVVGEDITEMQQLSEQLEYHDSHDDLTGLVNRREFELRLNRALDVADKDKAEHAVCFLDLDQFKVVNDSCGHTAGDELLRQVSSLLRERLRKADTLARLGGDEFGILLEYCSLGVAEATARQILNDIRDYRFVWSEKSFSISMSIGIVPLTAESGTTIDIMKTADTACYAAKDAGRDRIHVYTSEDEDYLQRSKQMQWVSHINEALEQDRFTLYTQAIMPAAAGMHDAAYYEILVRMLSAGGNIITPDSFLPAAERFNLASRIDRWVVDRALQFMAQHPDLDKKITMLFINLSGQSLTVPDFQQRLMRIVLDSGINPGRICFEITETAAITNLTSASVFMHDMKELGCSFALDDFGSGLSSFAYLKQLPVDFIKIDGFFVKDMVEDPIDFAMVKCINDIGKIMGKRTIAEFVENDAILEKLRVLGLDFVQGYGIGKPFPLEDLCGNALVR